MGEIIDRGGIELLWTIMMDAMFTLFEAQYGRWELYKKLLSDIVGIDASEAEIEKVYKKERKKAEAAEVLTDEKLPPGYYREYWARINGAIIKELAPDRFNPETVSEAEWKRSKGRIRARLGQETAIEMGRQIFLEVMGNPEYFRVDPKVIAFLGDMTGRGGSFCLVTNQEPTGVLRLLKYHGLSKYFPTVVVSDTVGYKKPDARFFKYALEMVNPSKKVAYVGNNPRNDMEGAAAAGIEHRFLYDPRGEHNDTPASVPFVRIGDMYEIFGHLGIL